MISLQPGDSGNNLLRTEWGNDGKDRGRNLEWTRRTLPGISRLRNRMSDPAGHCIIRHNDCCSTTPTSMAPGTVQSAKDNNCSAQGPCYLQGALSVKLHCTPQAAQEPAETKPSEGKTATSCLGRGGGWKAVWAGYLSEFRLPVRPRTFISVAASNLKVPAIVHSLRQQFKVP